MPQPDTRERRCSPRYPVDTRLFASIDGNTVLLRNISLSGIAIHARGLTVGSVHLLEVNINHRHMSLAVEILDTSTDGMLHARFIELTPESHRLIDEYIRELA